MNKPTRIVTTILVTLVIGGVFAYQDIHQERTDAAAAAYQQHPVTVILTDFFCGFLSGLIFYFGSGWLERRKGGKSVKAEDVKFYNEVARELQDKPINPGLWTKAFAETGGDDAKARALYIKYRVEQLAAIANREQAIKQAQSQRQGVSIFLRFAYPTVGWILMISALLTLMCAILIASVFIYDRVQKGHGNPGELLTSIVLFIFSASFVIFGNGALAKAANKKQLIHPALLVCVFCGLMVLLMLTNKILYRILWDG